MSGGRILVVDDDPIILKSLGKVLADEGYHVDSACHGREALERVAHHAPDVILLDLMMPVMNGRQFLHALHMELERPEIPVVVMTGVSGIGLQQALSMGACDMVEKPLDINRLLNKIALILYRAHGEHLPSTRAGLARARVSRATKPDDRLVLIVSPDRAALGYLDELLAAHAYRIVWLLRVTDELSRLARALEPRAILLDLQLPRATGLTALRRLRADHALDDVPILVLSDDAAKLAMLRPEIHALDADTLLEPFEDDELLELLAGSHGAAWMRASVV